MGRHGDNGQRLRARSATASHGFNDVELVAIVDRQALAALEANQPRRDRVVDPLVLHEKARRVLLMEYRSVRPARGVAVSAIGSNVAMAVP
jgi:hypothetical protein